jgi:hypothetical protein
MTSSARTAAASFVIASVRQSRGGDAYDELAAMQAMTRSREEQIAGGADQTRPAEAFAVF